MPRTRSRPKTEEKFQHAVLALVGRHGCGNLGINLVAKEAGADKVLIYRYFGDYNGLLQTVADSRQWLPTVNEMTQLVSTKERDPLSTLHKIEQIVRDHIRNDASTHQLTRWRRAGICPICKTYSKEWSALWKQLPIHLSAGLPYEQRELWAQSCALLSLMIEAELCDEAVSRNCLELVAKGLEAIKISHSDTESTLAEETLPTNLL